LPLDDPNGAHPGDLARDAGLMHHLDDVVDVLVCFGLLLRQALAALGASDDATRLQLLVDAAAAGVLDRSGAAHCPAGPVTGRAEGSLHAAGLTDQYP